MSSGKFQIPFAKNNSQPFFADQIMNQEDGVDERKEVDFLTLQAMLKQQEEKV